MKILKYLIQFFFIYIFFIIFRVLGYKLSSNFSAKAVSILGPFFRSEKKIISNFLTVNKNISSKQAKITIKEMWKNYGRILSEYIYIKKFRNSQFQKYLTIDGEEILRQVKENNKPVIFVSGHFNNFELMAMQIEKSGINLAAIYRPLNNIFLNKVMEKIRKKYICKKQIKKGLGGTREIVKLIRKNYSVALMIDQRVSEGKKVNFYGRPASTTTIPAQLAKKYDLQIIPIYIERYKKFNFKMTINKPINFSKQMSVVEITEELNTWLEKMITKNPSQWIWTHGRWK